LHANYKKKLFPNHVHAGLKSHTNL